MTVNTVDLDQDGSKLDVERLADWLLETGRHAMVVGAERATLERHRNPLSLDFWIRAEVAVNADMAQATAAVVARICATGLFEETIVVDPFTGECCRGIALTAATELRAAA